MKRQGLKKALIIVHDLVMTGIAVLATFYVRFEGPFLDERLTVPMLIGSAATIAGVAIIVVRRPRVVAPSTKGGL